MSYKSGFFDAQDLGEGNFDRVYNSADLAHYFSLFVGNGVFLNPTTSLQVSSQPTPNMSIKVALGSGWINGYFITVTSPETLTIPTAHGSLPRIDSILMRLDLGTRQIKLVVSPGTAASSPQPNSLIRTGNYYDLELAQITVPAGATSITQSLIRDTRYFVDRCGLVKGLIDQIDATAFFNQYQDQFNTWFEGLQNKLSGNVAANLQLQIDEINSRKPRLLWQASTGGASGGAQIGGLSVPGLEKYRVFAVTVNCKGTMRTILLVRDNLNPDLIAGSGFLFEYLDSRDSLMSYNCVVKLSVLHDNPNYTLQIEQSQFSAVVYNSGERVNGGITIHCIYGIL